MSVDTTTRTTADTCPSWCAGDHADNYGHHGLTRTVTGIDTAIHLGASLYEDDPGPVTEIILGRTGAMVCLTARQVHDLTVALIATMTEVTESSTGEAPQLDSTVGGDDCGVAWCSTCFEDHDGVFHVSDEVTIPTMRSVSITTDVSHSPDSTVPWEINVELSAGSSAALDRDQARQLGRQLIEWTRLG